MKQKEEGELVDKRAKLKEAEFRRRDWDGIWRILNKSETSSKNHDAFCYLNMHKRQGKKEAKLTLSNDKLKKTNKRHPIQQIVSTLPQLAISCAILFCAITTFNVSLNDVR